VCIIHTYERMRYKRLLCPLYERNLCSWKCLSAHVRSFSTFCIFTAHLNETLLHYKISQWNFH
jgi:hypothetical protein